MIVEYQDDVLTRAKTIVKATPSHKGTYRLQTVAHPKLAINVVSCDHGSDTVFVRLPQHMKLEVVRG